MDFRIEEVKGLLVSVTHQQPRHYVGVLELPTRLTERPSREKIYTRSRADPRETKHLCEKWSERLAGNEDAVYIARNRGDLRAIDLAQLQPGCSWI